MLIYIRYIKAAGDQVEKPPILSCLVLFSAAKVSLLRQSSHLSRYAVLMQVVVVVVVVVCYTDRVYHGRCVCLSPGKEFVLKEMQFSKCLLLQLSLDC